MSLAAACLAARSVLTETLLVWLRLLGVLVPALIVVKVLQELGAVDRLGALLSPAMGLVGLPAELGVVWAATLSTNILTGMIVFFEIAADTPLSVEQVTVLGTLMLIGHSLPVEGAVAKRAGVPWRVTIALRVGGALVLGASLHLAYERLDLLQEPARFAWRPPETAADTIPGWALGQLVTLGLIFLVILVLIASMALLRRLGIERWMHAALAPLLRLLGIGRSASNVAVIGVALGLTYGAGLLIRDLDDGVMSRRDAFLALCFLGLAHSLIEDTVLILALGADLSGILWARLTFSIAVVAALARAMAFVERRSVGS